MTALEGSFHAGRGTHISYYHLHSAQPTRRRAKCQAASLGMATKPKTPKRKAPLDFSQIAFNVVRQATEDHTYPYAILPWARNFIGSMIISRKVLLTNGLSDLVLRKLAIRSPPPLVAVPGLMVSDVSTPPCVITRLPLSSNRPVFHALQFLPDSPELESYASDGSGDRRSRLDSWGSRRADRLTGCGSINTKESSS